MSISFPCGTIPCEACRLIVPFTEAIYRKIAASCSRGRVVVELPEKLVPMWCDDYRRYQNPRADLVEVTTGGEGSSFTYLFDLDEERNIVAFGKPAYATHKRDAARMQGHPLLDDPRYHRGHLMAHSIGGGTDINLVPQLAKINIGAFRTIEKQVRQLAKENVPCFYFVRTIYSGNSQIPSAFEQCVVQPTRQISYTLHKQS